MHKRPDLVLLALVALIVVCVTALLLAHVAVPAYLWAIAFAALTGAGVAVPTFTAPTSPPVLVQPIAGPHTGVPVTPVPQPPAA